MRIYTVKATCEIAKVVCDLAKGDPLKKRIVFCEDKFTLALELALAEKNGGTFGTRVFSFNRFMHKYLGADEKTLSIEGCSLIVKRLLLENKDKLVCFKNVYDPNLASVVYELIAQLKSAKVTPMDILRAKENESGNLKRKLTDIYLIFDAYENFLARSNFTDGNNKLRTLPYFFNTDAEIKDTEVIIAGFPSLNRTLCEIFISLEQNAKSLSYVLVQGDNEGVYTNETYNFAISRSNASALAYLSDYETDNFLDVVFAPEKKDKTGTFSEKVHIYRAKTVGEEVEYVARLISKGVRDGARFKDFAVCVPDASIYENVIKRTFSDYGLPHFIDATENLGKHPLTKLICAYIDVVRRNFSPADVLAFIKNPLFESDISLTDAFENYFLKNAVNRKTVREPFTFVADEIKKNAGLKSLNEPKKEKDDGYEETEIMQAELAYEQKFEAMRKKAAELCSFLKADDSFSAAVSAIKIMLETLGVAERANELSTRLEDLKQAELSAFNAQAYEKLLSVLSTCSLLLGDKKMPLKEVKNVILSGMTACKVALIPKYDDCVFIGDFRAIKYNRYDYLFITGLCEDVPAVKFDSALLCDRDILKMESSFVLVEPKIKEVNRRERENVCMATVAFKKGLYLSAPARSIDGEEKKLSEIIDYALAAFSDDMRKVVISDSFKNDAVAQKIGGLKAKQYLSLGYMTERSAAFAFSREVSEYKEGLKNDFSVASTYYSVAKENGYSTLPDEILQSVNCETGYYTKGVNYAPEKLSATAIEGFFRCPYANFLSRGVKLLRREQSEMQQTTLGNLIHEVASEFTKVADFERGEQYAENLASEIFDSVCEKPEYSRYKKSADGGVAFSYIKREAVRFCKTIFSGVSHSSFKPEHLEIAFGYGKIPAISINTRTGVKKVIGKADRVDVCLDKMTIIDYKTGQVDTGEEELYTGRKLQLYLYAKAFSDKYEPVGAYYFPVSDEFGKEDDEFVMSMRGKTIADEKTAMLIDDSITEQTPKGRYVSVNLSKSKEGKFKYPGNLLSRDEFSAYLTYAEKVAGEGLSEINEGVIIPSPVENACAFCDFHGMCGYDEAIDNRTRKISGGVTKEMILQAAVTDEKNDVSKVSETNGQKTGGDSL